MYSVTLQSTDIRVVLLGSGLGSVLPDGAGSALCVLHLRDGTERLGLFGASHGDGVFLLLRHRPLENGSESKIALMPCMPDAVGGAVGLSGSLCSLYAVFKDILWDVTDWNHVIVLHLWDMLSFVPLQWYYVLFYFPVMFKPTSINTSLDRPNDVLCCLFAAGIQTDSVLSARLQIIRIYIREDGRLVIEFKTHAKFRGQHGPPLTPLRPQEKSYLHFFSSAFLSIRPVCPWAPHSARPQVPPDASRSPRRHRVWHSAAVECSEFWLSVPAVEGHQLLQQVSQSIRSHRRHGWLKLWWVSIKTEPSSYTVDWTQNGPIFAGFEGV